MGHRKLLAIVALIAAIPASSALALSRSLNLPFGAALSVRTYTGTHTSVTYAISTYDRAVRVRQDGGCDPTVMCEAVHDAVIKRIDPIKVTCHGGVADIKWEVGDLESTVPRTGITLTVTLDGRPLASLIKGGFNGTYDDGPAQIDAVTRCSRGTHNVWVQVTRLKKEWGIPYADPRDRVARGFVVTETW